MRPGRRPRSPSNCRSRNNRRIRAGWVTINHAFDLNAPFGGYKRSGNGREWSEYAFHEYLEVKSTLGFAPDKVVG